jgi:hypothetical protein
VAEDVCVFSLPNLHLRFPFTTMQLTRRDSWIQHGIHGQEMPNGNPLSPFVIPVNIRETCHCPKSGTGKRVHFHVCRIWRMACFRLDEHRLCITASISAYVPREDHVCGSA